MGDLQGHLEGLWPCSMWPLATWKLDSAGTHGRVAAITSARNHLHVGHMVLLVKQIKFLLPSTPLHVALLAFYPHKCFEEL